MGKRELVALLSLSSWCLVIVVWLFLAVPWVCLQFVIVVSHDHTHLLFLIGNPTLKMTFKAYNTLKLLIYLHILPLALADIICREEVKEES